MDLFKVLVWDNLVRAALNYLFAAAPFLAWVPLRNLISVIVTYFSDKLYEGLDEFIDVKSIVFKNKELEKEFDHEAVKLRIISKTVDLESEEFKKAKETAKERLSEYTRFGPARKL